MTVERAVRATDDTRKVCTLRQVETGQGVYTAVAMILATSRFDYCLFVANR
jgi:hypothetical protein